MQLHQHAAFCIMYFHNYDLVAEAPSITQIAFSLGSGASLTISKVVTSTN